MSVQVNFTWPTAQDLLLQLQIAPPTNIAGWTLEFDLMYRVNSPQPIYSAYNLSGTITVNSPGNGVFQVPLSHTLISGLIKDTNVLAYTARRIDSGNASDIAGGLINITPF